MDVAHLDLRVRAIYLYLVAKLFFCRIFKFEWKSEKLFGSTFVFSGASQFVAAFKKIFIEERYFFKTDNKEPLILDCGESFGLCKTYFTRLYPDATVVTFDSLEKCRPLSQFIRKPVDLLKLDFPGAEAIVLDELATSSRMAKVRELFVEFRHDLENDQSLPVVLKALRTYRVRFGSEIQDQSVQEILFHAKRRPHVSAKKVKPTQLPNERLQLPLW